MATDTYKSVEPLNTIVDMARNAELLNSMKRLGLNQYEAQAYLTLATLGTKTAGEISEHAELPRPRVYDVPAGLQDRGFVAIQPGRPVRYAALPIGEAIKTLKKQKESSLLEEIKDIDELSKSVEQKMKGVSVSERYGIEENVWTLKGRDAIYSKMHNMISNAKQHILLSSTEEGLARKLKEHKSALETARSRGVKVNLLSPMEQKMFASKFTESTKITHTQKSVPTRLMLSDNEALLFLTNDGSAAEDEVALWVRSPHVVNTLKGGLLAEKK